jgi:hypothetical protein
VDSGWIDIQSGKQIYDNNGNLPTDPIDFQMSKVRRLAIKDMFEVLFSNWTHLDGMEMHWNQITNNGSNDYMVLYLSHLCRYVAVGKWQSVGGRRLLKPTASTQSSIQDFLKNAIIAEEEKKIDSLKKFIVFSAPLIVTSESTGCLISAVINALRINSSEQFHEALQSVMSMEMLSQYCNTNHICNLQRCQCEFGAVDFLVSKFVELCANISGNDLQLYILYDPIGSCHGVSVDLRKQLVYDSASDVMHPYHFCEEVLALLGFTRSNLSLELRKLDQINRKYKRSAVKIR